MKTAKNLILWIVLIFCVIVAISGFILSFANLKDLAEDAGIPDTISFLWPICIDCFIIISDIAILHYSIAGKKSFGSWALLFIFTIISIFYNMANSSDSLLFKSMYAIPIIAQFAALKVIYGLILTNYVSSCPLSQEYNSGQNENKIGKYMCTSSNTDSLIVKDDNFLSKEETNKKDKVTNKQSRNQKKEVSVFSDQKTIFQY